MHVNKDNRFEVVATVIIRDEEGRYLILRRNVTKRRFPGKWTVPGGRLELRDFVDQPRQTKYYWYNVLEGALRREVLEETGLTIDEIEFVTSLATVHADGAPSIVLSFMASYAGGVLHLQADECDAAVWIQLEEAAGYDLIDGIYDELVMADQRLRGIRTEWRRAN